jgi:DNA-directed RNA polymerase
MTVDAFDLMRQAKWEQEGTNRAVRLYREGVAEAEASGRQADTAPGKALLREIIPSLSDHIRVKQKEMEVAIAGQTKQPKWGLVINLLEADVLAAITLRHALTVPGCSHEAGVSRTAVCKYISDSVRDQVEYSRWVWEQKELNKEAKGDPNHRDILKIFQRRFPKAQRRTWVRWRLAVLKLRTEPWSEDLKIVLGGCLLQCLLDVAPEYFMLSYVRKGAKNPAFLGLTEKAEALIKDIHTRRELARPQFMPMIIPPIPWSYPSL